MTDKYNLKIPLDLVDFFQNYLNEHKELGFTFVSKFLLHILQNEAKKLMEKMHEKKEEKRITLPSGTYSKEDIEKLFSEG